jgi:hypothetical protein
LADNLLPEPHPRPISEASRALLKPVSDRHLSLPSVRLDSRGASYCAQPGSAAYFWKDEGQPSRILIAGRERREQTGWKNKNEQTGAARQRIVKPSAESVIAGMMLV